VDDGAERTKAERRRRGQDEGAGGGEEAKEERKDRGADKAATREERLRRDRAATGNRVHQKKNGRSEVAVDEWEGAATDVDTLGEFGATWPKNLHGLSPRLVGLN
jgi:hypothetical protein